MAHGFINQFISSLVCSGKVEKQGARLKNNPTLSLSDRNLTSPYLVNTLIISVIKHSNTTLYYFVV